MSVPVASSQPRPQLPALTGLRFFAALLVVGVHFGRYCLPQPFLSFAQEGAVGVGLFFVLSGFILVYTYATPAGAMRGGRRAFYVARFARIYPVYALGLLVALGPALSGPPVPFTPVVALSTLTLTQSWLPGWHFAWNSPGWSLSVEAAFYAVFPVLCPVIVRQSSRILWLLIPLSWLASQVVPWIYLHVQPDPVYVQPAPYWLDEAFFNPLVSLPAFLTGMATAALFLRHRTAPRRSGIGALAALLGTGLALIAAQHCPDLAVRDGLLLPVFATVILFLAWGHGHACHLLGSGLMVRLGEASYAVYILHYPIHAWLVHVSGVPDTTLQTSLPVFCGYLAFTTVLACMVYQWVEVPARGAIRHGWEHRSSRRDARWWALRVW